MAMWRYLTGGIAAVAVVGAGALFFTKAAPSTSVLPPQPGTTAQSAEPLPASAPEATGRTREQKRFDRYDKDRDGSITREEYLAARRKAYAKLDTDGDGTLSFDEWAIKATTKFATADADTSGAMTATEFATTAVKRKPARPRADCPPAQATAEEN